MPNVKGTFAVIESTSAPSGNFIKDYATWGSLTKGRTDQYGRIHIDIGGDVAHNNTPLVKAVYAWLRTA